MFLKTCIFKQCIGFTCQGFSCRNIAGVASAGRDQELPPCQREPVPDSLKPDLPLAKAELISNAGGAPTDNTLTKTELCSRFKRAVRKLGVEEGPFCDSLTLKSPESVMEQEEVLHDNHDIAAFGEHHSDVFFLSPGGP